jgi:hypothetical protein
MSEMTAELEAAFTPHPGSSRDAVNKMADAETPLAQPASAGPRNPKPVRVQNMAAPDGVYRTLVLQPSEARQLIPQDPNRKRAVIIAVDNAVILCDTQALAQSGNNLASAGTSVVELTPAAPGTGVNYQFTNTTPYVIELLSVTGKLTTDSTTGNRSVGITITDANSNLVWRVQDATNVVASSSISIYAEQGITLNSSASGNTQVPLPANYPIQPGWTVSLTGTLDASDDAWTNIAITYEQVVSNPPFPDGFYLPVNVPVEIKNRGLVWAVNPANGSSRISVVTERYENA